jgi:hypothetical protein
MQSIKYVYTENLDNARCLVEFFKDMAGAAIPRKNKTQKRQNPSSLAGVLPLQYWICS